MSTMVVETGFGAAGRGLRPGSRAGAPPARQVRVPVTTPAQRAMHSDRPATETVRLTRRGRLLVTGLAVLLAALAAVLATGGGLATAVTPAWGSSSEAEAPSAGSTTGERVTVRPGQTLWEIALREEPAADPRETVAAILELNGLTTSQVQAGAVLRLP